MSVHDVVVIGAGMAGSVAAARAQELGCRVLLVERSSRVPGWGNSVISGGCLHALGADPRIEPALLAQRLRDATDGYADADVVAAWAGNAARAVGWIEAHGGCLVTDPTTPFRSRMFAPVGEPQPGLRYRGLGVATFLSHLADGVLASGGQVVRGTRALRCGPGGGGTWTVALRGGDGAHCAKGAAVVLADGGFQADRALLRTHLGTDRVMLRATNTGRGDGLRMGLSIGAVLSHMAGFYGHLLARDALRSRRLWPYPILDDLAENGLVVTGAGVRLIDEALGGLAVSNAVATSNDPLGCWVIFDDRCWNEQGRGGVMAPNPYLRTVDAGMVSAPSMSRLAQRTGIPMVALERTASQLINSNGGSQPTRTGIVRVDTPPFHAIPAVAGVTFMFGGLRVDGRSRVVRADNEPIPGVYAAGGTMAGLHGGPRFGYAGGLLEAAVFGLLAGEDAARYAAAGSRAG